MFIFVLHFVVVLHFIFELHFVVIVLHFISRLLFHITGTPPWLLRPVKDSTSSELYPTTFDCLCFSVYHERYGFEWTFSPPQALFKKLSLYAPYSFRILFACSNSYVKTL